MLGGLALLAALGAGAFFSTRTVEGTRLPADVAVAAAPVAPTPVVEAPAPAATPQPAAAELAAPTAAPAPATVTAPTSTSVASVVAIPARSTADSAALASDLRTALSHASRESSAARAVEEADRLEPRAVLAEEQVMVALVRAQAYGTLGQDAKSCAALRGGVERAKGTSYEARLAGMIALCK